MLFFQFIATIYLYIIILLLTYLVTNLFILIIFF